MKGQAFFVTLFLIFLFVVGTLTYCGMYEYENSIGLRNFNDRQELVNFLINDNTDTIEYSDDFDCEHFCVLLQNNAMLSGYNINIVVITGQEMNKYFDRPDMSDDDLHAVCGAICNTWKGYEYVYIEPQTDEIRRVGFLE